MEIIKYKDNSYNENQNPTKIKDLGGGLRRERQSSFGLHTIKITMLELNNILKNINILNNDIIKIYKLIKKNIKNEICLNLDILEIYQNINIVIRNLIFLILEKKLKQLNYKKKKKKRKSYNLKNIKEDHRRASDEVKVTKPCFKGRSKKSYLRNGVRKNFSIIDKRQNDYDASTSSNLQLYKKEEEDNYILIEKIEKQLILDEKENEQLSFPVSVSSLSNINFFKLKEKNKDVINNFLKITQKSYNKINNIKKYLNNDLRMCYICLNNDRMFQFLPCKHTTYCNKCILSVIKKKEIEYKKNINTNNNDIINLDVIYYLDNEITCPICRDIPQYIEKII